MIVYSQFPSLGFNRFWVDRHGVHGLQALEPELPEPREPGAPGEVNVSGRGEPVRADAARVSAGLFTALGVDAELGRYFSAADDLPNTEKVVVLSDGLWRRAFAGDPAIVGRRIKVDGEDRTVLGVMPPGFTIGNERVEVWLPLALDPAKPGNRGSHYLYMVGRLKPDVSLAQARGEIDDLIARWKQRVPGTPTRPTPRTTSWSSSRCSTTWWGRSGRRSGC